MGGSQFGFPAITPVVKRLLILNFGIFFVTFVLAQIDSSAARFVFEYMAINPSHWFVGAPFFPFWEPVTSGFLHSLSDPMHVIRNMLGLYFFGTLLEGILGARRFVWVYFGALIAGSLAHLVFQPWSDPGVSAVGASGAVLGVLVMAAVLRPNQQVILIFIPISLKWLAIGVLGLDVYFLLQELGGVQDRVAHWVHLGGAAFGFVAARKGWIWKDPITDWKIKQEQRQRAQVQTDDLKMDELLAKIHKEGMSSLSKRERAFLKKVSNRG